MTNFSGNNLQYNAEVGLKTLKWIRELKPPHWSIYNPITIFKWKMPAASSRSDLHSGHGRTYGQVSAWGIWPELALVGSNVSPQWPSRRDGGGGQQPQPLPPPPPPGVRLLFQFVKSLESLRMNLKEINSFINKNDKSCGFFTDATYQQEEVPVYLVWIFSFVYFYEKILDFINYFYWNDQVISFFH